MASINGSNYTKENIDAQGKAGIGEVVSKVRCSFDSWSAHAGGAGDTIVLLAKIPKGARIKSLPTLAGAATIALLSIEDGSSSAVAVGDKVAQESDILLTDVAGGDIAASGFIFVEFLLD